MSIVVKGAAFSGRPLLAPYVCAVNVSRSEKAVDNISFTLYISVGKVSVCVSALPNRDGIRFGLRRLPFGEAKNIRLMPSSTLPLFLITASSSLCSPQRLVLVGRVSIVTTVTHASISGTDPFFCRTNHKHLPRTTTT